MNAKTVPIASVVPFDADGAAKLPIAKSINPPITTGEPKPEEVVALLKKTKIAFFHDEFGQLFADIDCGQPTPHREQWPLSPKSRPLCRRIRAIARKRKKWNLTRRVLRETIELLEADADGRTQEVTLSNRISESDGRIWIDMADPSWRSIEVDADGWRVASDNTPRFRRHRHQAALPDPVQGGKIDELFEIIPTDDESDRLLLLTWLISALMPSVITPILVHIGQPGGAKTTRSLILRSLIDPSSTGVLGETERSHLLQVMFHHAIPCFGNLGQFDRKDADFFCRAVTGAGFEKRQLYTDMDEVLFRFKRSIIINAIELPTTRCDFLDRCLVLEVERVAKFKPRNIIDEQFKKSSPRLFGAILDLLASTLRQLPLTEAPTEFRMADYARVGRAVARALNRTEKDFDDAYRSTIHNHAYDTLDDDTFAASLVLFMMEADNEAFEGTAQASEKLVDFARSEVSCPIVQDLAGKCSMG